MSSVDYATTKRQISKLLSSKTKAERRILHAITHSDLDELAEQLPQLSDRQWLGQHIQLVAKALEHSVKVSNRKARKYLLDQLPPSEELAEAIDAEGWNLAHHVCRTQQNRWLVRQLVAKYPECFSSGNHKGKYPLHYACKYQESIEEFLVKFESLFEEVDNKGRTPVHMACMHMSDSVLLMLAEKFSKIFDRKDCSGQTPVHIICSRQLSVDVARRLCESCSHCFRILDNRGRTPVHLLCQQPQDSETMSLMLDKFDKSFQLPNKRKRLPLHAACGGDRTGDETNIGQTSRHVMRQLVDKCADGFLLADDNGETPLHVACEQLSSCEAMEVLIKRFGSDFENQQPHWKESLLMAACRRRCGSPEDTSAQVMRLLVDSFAPFFSDSETGREAIRRLARANGESQTAMDQLPLEGDWPLHDACREFSKPFVTLLFAIFPLRFFLVVDSNGDTPLDAAAKSDGDKQVEPVRKLLEELQSPEPQEALVDCLSRLNLRRCVPADSRRMLKRRLRFGKFAGETLLHFACLYGHEENIKFLMNDLGLKLDQHNDAGKSCIDFAYEKGQQSVAFRAATEGDISTMKLLELLDPATQVLQRPDLQPQRVLEAHTVFSSPHSDPVHVHMFKRALRLDDSTVFRSLLLEGKLDADKLAEVMESLKKDKNFAEFVSGAIEHSGDPLDVALNCDRVNIVADFAISRQTDVIPTCLRFLIQMQHRLKQKLGKHEQMLELKEKLVAIVANALDVLYFEAEEKKPKDEKELLFRYLDADFDGGPKFDHLLLDDYCRYCGSCCCCSNEASGRKKQCSVFEMIEAAGCIDVFGTAAVRKYIDREWRKTAKILCGNIPWQPPLTLRHKFYVHAFAFLAVLIFFAWYVTDFSHVFYWADVVVSCHFLSLLLLEIHDFYTKRKLFSFFLVKRLCRLPEYCIDNLNVFDILSIFCMGAGLTLKLLIVSDCLKSEHLYTSQMLLASAFMLLGFRAVYLLTYFETVGPMISMIKVLLVKDLLPFLALISVILAAFGVFFFNLLYPCSDEQARPLYRIFTIPAFMVFGYYEKDFDEHVTNSTQHFHPGRIAYDYVFFFLFLGLVNIVMINLLIALFSESVKSVKSRAFVVWRQFRWQMLREFQRSCLLPPPLSVIEFCLWPVLSLISCLHRANSRRRNDDGAQYSSANAQNLELGRVHGQSWWEENNLQNSPEDYQDFLKFQASVLRHKRQMLCNKLVGNRDDAAALQAHAENVSHRLQSELQQELQTVQARAEGASLRLQSQLQQELRRSREESRKAIRELRESQRQQLVDQQQLQQTAKLEELANTVQRLEGVVTTFENLNDAFKRLEARMGQLVESSNGQQAAGNGTE